jgi:hypothetical protein
LTATAGVSAQEMFDVPTATVSKSFHKSKTFKWRLRDRSKEVYPLEKKYSGRDCFDRPIPPVAAEGDQALENGLLQNR